MLSHVLARRFVGGNQREGLVSLISTISVIGMALAVSVLVLVLSVMNGFEQEFKDRILNLAPHARLRLAEPLSDWQTVVQAAQTSAQVNAVFPFNDLQALAVRGTTVQPLLVQGMSGRQLTQFSPMITGNQLADNRVSTQISPLRPKQIILGASLANKLNLGVGDTLRILTVGETELARAPGTAKAARVFSLTLIGLLESGTELDQSIGIVELDYAARLTGQDGSIQGLQFQVDDIFDARSIAWRTANELNIYGHISDWKYEFGNLYTAIQLSRQLVVMLVASIVGIAVFNIFVTLGMVVRHKRSEIAILKSLGMQRGQLMYCMIWQGIYIALPGCMIGLVMGCLMAFASPSLVGQLQQWMGVELLNTDIYPIDYLPSKIRLIDLLLITSVSLGMSLLATLIPAYNAAKLEPAKVLHADV